MDQRKKELEEWLKQRTQSLGHDKRYTMDELLKERNLYTQEEILQQKGRTFDVLEKEQPLRQPLDLTGTLDRAKEFASQKVEGFLKREPSEIARDIGDTLSIATSKTPSQALGTAFGIHIERKAAEQQEKRRDALYQTITPTDDEYKKWLDKSLVERKRITTKELENVISEYKKIEEKINKRRQTRELTQRESDFYTRKITELSNRYDNLVFLYEDNEKTANIQQRIEIRELEKFRQEEKERISSEQTFIQKIEDFARGFEDSLFTKRGTTERKMNRARAEVDRRIREGESLKIDVPATIGMPQVKSRAYEIGEIGEAVNTGVTNFFIDIGLASLTGGKSLLSRAAAWGTIKGAREFEKTGDFNKAIERAGESALWVGAFGKSAGELQKLGFKLLEKAPPEIKNAILADAFVRIASVMVAAPMVGIVTDPKTYEGELPGIKDLMLQSGTAGALSFFPSYMASLNKAKSIKIQFQKAEQELDQINKDIVRIMDAKGYSYTNNPATIELIMREKVIINQLKNTVNQRMVGVHPSAEKEVKKWVDFYSWLNQNKLENIRVPPKQITSGLADLIKDLSPLKDYIYNKNIFTGIEKPLTHELIKGLPKMEKPIAKPDGRLLPQPQDRPQDRPQIPRTEPTPDIAIDKPPMGKPVPKDEIKPKEQTDISKVKTGDSFTGNLYQGKGKSRSEIYKYLEKPLLGEGEYFAFDEESAKLYGDKITRKDIQLKNPLVIRDDNDWDAIISKAGWEYSQLFGLDKDKASQWIDNLHKVILEDGHDGVIVSFENDIAGDFNRITNNPIKSIDNMFGHDQIVVYPEKQAIDTPITKPETIPDKVKIDKEIVSDSKGKPIEFYHGTNQDFNKFDKDKLLSTTLHGGAFYFTDSKQEGEKYAKTYKVGGEKTLIRAHIYADKIFDYNNDKFTPQEINNLVDVLDLPDSVKISKPTTWGNLDSSLDIYLKDILIDNGYEGFKKIEQDGSTTIAVFDDSNIEILEKTKLADTPQTTDIISKDDLLGVPKEEVKNEVVENISDIDLSKNVRFKKEFIDITLRGGKVEKVAAETYKGIAIHKEINGTGNSVTHIKSSISIVNFKNKEQARVFARILGDTFDFSLGRDKLDILIDDEANKYFKDVAKWVNDNISTTGHKKDNLIKLENLLKDVKNDVITPENLMDRIEIIGKDVSGFTLAMRKQIMNELIKGIKQDTPSIDFKVDGDGYLEIRNAPDSIAKILTALKLKLKPEKKTPPSFGRREKAKPKEKTVDVKKDGADSLVSRILEEYIAKGEKLTNDSLFKMGRELLGENVDLKTVSDLMEVAVNKRILDIKFTDNPLENLKMLEDMLNKLPTQGNIRSKEMLEYQQFSTPPNISYIANWVANVNSNDVMLEPSAGVGGIAIFSKKEGATTIVNELSQRRLDIIKKLPFDKFFNENAEQINNILPQDIKPTVVIMNPPFSTSAGRTIKTTSMNATLHLEQALKRLEPDGRLVAIVGNSMNDTAPMFREWWDKIKKEYNVRANIRIDGSNYRKYGTTYDVQMLVIDKTGETKSVVDTGTVKNLGELITRLEDIKNDRRLQERPRTKPDTIIETGKETDGGRTPTRTTPPRTVDGSRSGDRMPRPTPSGPIQGTDSGKVVDTASEKDIQTTDTTIRGGTDSEGFNAVEGQKGQAKGDIGTRTSEPKREPSIKTELEKDVGTRKVDKVKQAENTDDIYSYYAPQKIKIKGSKPHPAPIVESAAMGAVSPPDIDYVPNLPKEIITDGELSDIQLEFIAYAGYAHNQILHDGNRRGIFNGDGTGVGKGRQIAGIILDNFRQGREKAVWVSEKKKLFNDATRDWTALRQDPNLLINIDKIKSGQRIKNDKGILFTTYDTLKMGSKESKGQLQINNDSRLNQLVDWLGKDFDGVIIFDEAHNMGNALGDKPSAMALTGIKLQELLPNARIAYFSATGSTEIANMAYAPRLGLWGEGTGFESVSEFIEKISNGGLAAMELVARDMKATGSYLARSISYKGVEYDTLTHKISPIQNEIYNALAKAWQLVIERTESAMAETMQNKNTRQRGRILAVIFANEQRFFNQVLTSMSAPSLITDIEKQLEEGKSVVLQLVNTNEAAQERGVAKALEQDMDLGDIEISPKQLLLDYLEKTFPVQQLEAVEVETVDMYGRPKIKTEYRPVLDSEGNPVFNQEMLRVRNELIEDVKDLKTPESILDMLLNEFGSENVAEITGRKKRLITDKKTGKTIHETRSSTYRKAEEEAFQSGKKRILVFSDAGGTGASYHSSVLAKNQQQRVHYLVQAGWSASKAMQGFGRTHRSAQVNAPIYKLVTTDIKGQKRFVSTIARRLDQMGALTKGQREASGGVFSATDNLEGEVAKRTLYVFYKDLFTNAYPDIDGKGVLRRMNALNKLVDSDGRFKDNVAFMTKTDTFMNRLLMLEVDEQNKVFEEFVNLLDETTKQLEERGLLDKGLENYKAEKLEIVDEKIISNVRGAKTKYIQIKAWQKNRIIKYGELRSIRDNFIGLVNVENDAGIKEVKAVYKGSSKTKRDGSIVKTYVLYNPTFDKRQVFQEDTLAARTTAIDNKDFRQEWEKALSEIPELREETLHMLSGTLLPVWDKLPKEGFKVYRIPKDDDSYLLGRIIDEDKIDEVLRRFDAKREKISTQLDNPYNAILKEGKTLKLQEHNLILKPSVVAGQTRIELTGDMLRFFTRAYPDIYTETIQSKPRYFIPLGDKGISIINDLIKSNPISEIVEGRKGIQAMAKSPESTISKRIDSKVKDKFLAEPISRSEIEKLVSELLEIPITQGKYRGKAKGIFKIVPETIKLKKTKDLEVLFHEVGHFFDKKFNLTNKSFQIELIKLGTPVSGRNYTPQEVMEEGTAEFVRLYVTNRQYLTRQAPEFMAHFKEVLKNNEMLKEFLNTMQIAVENYIDQSPRDRVLGNISVSPNKRKFDLEEKFERFYTVMVDDVRPMERAVNKIIGDKSIPLSKNPYIQVSIYRGRASGLAKTFLEYGVVDEMGDKISKGLREILEPIAKDINNFRVYLVSKRGLELMERGVETGLIRKDLEQNIIDLESEQFIETSKELQTYQDHVLDQLVKSGILSKKAMLTMRRLNENYVPFYRVMNQASRGAGTGYQAYKPTKTIRGSTRDIADPIESIIKNTYLFIDLAERNKIGRLFADLTREFDGTGQFLEYIPPDLQSQVFKLEEIKKPLENILNDEGVDTEDLDLDVSARIFRPIKPRGDLDVITIYQNGKPTYWQVHDYPLYRAFMQLGKRNFPKWFKIFSIPTQILRKGALLSPDFAARNPVRDAFDMMVYSQYGFKAGIDTALGLAASLGNKEIYYKWLSSGAAMADLQAMDREGLQLKTQDILAKGLKKRYLNPLNILSSTSQRGEEASRIGEFMLGLKKESEKSGGVLTPEGFTRAAISSRIAGLDYNRAGEWGRVFNMMVAFYNPKIQGTDKLIRTINSGINGNKTERARAYKVILKAILTVTLPTIALYLLNRNNEYYKEIPQWEKDTFWLVPSEEEGEFTRIPKPHTLGAIFSVIPERIMSFYSEDDPKGFEELAERLMDSFFGIDIKQAPYVPIPDAFAPLIEAQTNYSYFFQRQIVPSSEVDLDNYAQFDVNTSELAKTLGNIFNWSPRVVDHIFKAYGAGLANYTLSIIDSGYSSLGKSDKPIFPERFRDYPVVKAFTTNAVKIYTETTKDFYNRLNDLERDYKTQRRINKIELDDYDKAKELRNLRWVQQYLVEKREQISEMQKKRKPHSEINIEILKMINVVRKELGMIPLSSELEYDEIAWKYRARYLMSEFKRENIKDTPSILSLLGFDASILDGPKAKIYRKAIEFIESDEYTIEEKLELIKAIESAQNILTESRLETIIQNFLK